MRLSKDELHQITSKIRDEAPSLQIYALEVIDDSVAKTERIMRWKEELPLTQSDTQNENEGVMDMLREYSFDEDGQIELTDELYIRWMLTVIVKGFMMYYDPSIRDIGVIISNQAVTELMLAKYRSDKANALVDLWKKIAMEMIRARLTARPYKKIDNF